MPEEKEAAGKKYCGYYKKTLGSHKLDAYLDFEAYYSKKFYFGGKEDIGKCIDFGGRIGEKTRWLNDCTVVDVDAEALEFMRASGIKCADSLGRIEDGSLDAVFSAQTLEHLENPLETLKEFNAKLKDGGRLILNLPAELQIFEADPDSLEDSDMHLNMFNYLIITTLLRKSGFEIDQYENIAVPHIIRSPRFNKAYIDLTYALTRSRTVRYLLFLKQLLVYWFKSFVVFAFVLLGKKVPFRFIRAGTGELLILAHKKGKPKP